MKKCSRNHSADFSKVFVSVLFSIVVFGAALARADADPNQLLAFKKIYVEPVQDNVDGTFRAPVEQSFAKIFEKNPRFELVTDKSQADTSLRTVVEKKTTGIDLEITVTLTGSNEVFTNERLSIPASASGRQTGEAVSQLLKAVLKRVPFYGTVTGRDSKELTFDIGAAHGLRSGDIIQISRIDQVKRHPLLKTIVDAQLVPVGSAMIDEVEDNISFGHVHNEITGESIKKYYKVTAIETRAPQYKYTPSRKKEEAANTDPLGDSLSNDYPADAATGEQAQEDNRPTLGFVGLGGQLSQFSNSTSVRAGASKVTGSAFTPGFRLNSELWITKRWFVDLLFGISTMSYSNDTLSTTNVPGTTSSTRTLGFNAGYKYLPDGSIYGPTVYAKIGYYNFKWDTAVDSANLLSPKTYYGVNLGIGGSLPIMSQDSGLMLGINMLILPSISEEGFKTGTDASSTVVNFFIGGYHFFSTKIAVRAGLQFEVYTADFDEGANKATTSQKVVGFVPSLLYYF